MENDAEHPIQWIWGAQKDYDLVGNIVSHFRSLRVSRPEPLHGMSDRELLYAICQGVNAIHYADTGQAYADIGELSAFMAQVLIDKRLES